MGGVSLPGTRGSITQSSQLWAQAGPPIWNWISTPFAMDLHHVSCSAGMRKVVPHQTDLRLHPTPSSLLVYILLRPGLVPILGNDRVPVIVSKMMGAS